VRACPPATSLYVEVLREADDGPDGRTFRAQRGEGREARVRMPLWQGGEGGECMYIHARGDLALPHKLPRPIYRSTSVRVDFRLGGGTLPTPETSLGSCGKGSA